MTTDDQVSPETIAAESARRRTFRRWLIGVGVWFAFMVIVRLWWGHVAESRLRAEIDRIRAAGEPFFAADFRTSGDFPDEQNAAHYYSLAFAAIVKEFDGQLSFDDIISNPRAYTQYPEEFKRAVDANREAIEYVRTASRTDQIDWKNQVAATLLNTNLSHLTQTRQLAKLIHVAALSHHHQGDQAEALACINDMLEMSEKVKQPDISCSTISSLVSIAISGLASYSIECVAPTLEFDDDGPDIDDDRIKPVSRKDIESLIERLLTVDSIWHGYEMAMIYERAQMADALDSILPNASPSQFAGQPSMTSFNGLMSWTFVRPAWQLDKVRMIHWIDDIRQAGLSGTWSNVNTVDAEYETKPDANGIEKVSTTMSNILMPSLARATELTYRVTAFQKMAGLALAIRLYEIDHGNRPKDLNQLVPDYIREVPIDPFDKSKGPIRYLPNATPPILYSVNSDEIDQGGQFDSKKGAGVNENVLDLPFFLNGNRPTKETLPSSNSRR